MQVENSSLYILWIQTIFSSTLTGENTINQINPKKLLNSKWTAVKPKNKEKHFTVIAVEFDDDEAVSSCFIEAVMSKRETDIQWQELKDISQWLQGWK